MERTSKLIGALICAALLSACGHNPPIPPGVVEAPKPVIDARILETCNVTLTPVADGAENYELFGSYKESINKLNACACKQREARNVLCQLTNPGCAPVPSCKEPDATTPQQQ